MSCRDILIVEDDRDIREGFAYILEAEGYAVHQAENGSIALDFLRDVNVQNPGCIILDLLMPIMDGKTFLETLNKEHPDDLCKIPIILTTAMRSYADEVSDLPCMVEKLHKPMNVSELVEAVHRHCGNS